MARTIYLKIDSLDYTLPDDFIREDMQDVFRKIVGLCGMSQRLPTDVPPPSEHNKLLIVANTRLIEVWEDKTLLEFEKEKLVAIATNHWFFNTFHIPLGNDVAELGKLPNSIREITESSEQIVVYEN